MDGDDSNENDSLLSESNEDNDENVPVEENDRLLNKTDEENNQDDGNENDTKLSEKEEIDDCDDDSDEQARKDREEEEESIQLIIDVLEEENERTTSGKRMRYKERAKDDWDEASATDKNDHLDQSVTDLKLYIPENVVTTPKHSKKIPGSAAISRRNQLALKLLKKHNSESGKIICGIVIILIMFGFGGTLLVLAWKLNMKDLFLLGGMFAGGGIVFLIAFVAVRCQARDETADYSVLYKPAMS